MERMTITKLEAFFWLGFPALFIGGTVALVVFGIGLLPPGWLAEVGKALVIITGTVVWCAHAFSFLMWTDVE